MDKKYKENYRQLGLNINFYRKNKQLTQMQLADMVDVEYSHISRIELGKVGASIDLLFAIADALEIPVNKLFEFRG